MKHFFYAVYILFYTGAVFLGGMFIGQFLERARKVAERKKAVSRPRTTEEMTPPAGYRDPKVAVMRKRD